VGGGRSVSASSFILLFKARALLHRVSAANQGFQHGRRSALEQRKRTFNCVGHQENGYCVVSERMNRLKLNSRPMGAEERAINNCYGHDSFDYDKSDESV